MLEAWSTRILHVCHAVEAVALVDILALVACWP
jgi:hypothetical protein